VANAGMAFKVRDLEVLPIACKHEEFETDEAGHHRFLGYVLKIGGVIFYHAGDTVGYSELGSVLSPLGIEVACLPINGQDWKRSSGGIKGNLNYRESADLCAAIGADLLVPMHYDLFAFNTENPAYFVDYLHSTYPGQKFKMFQPGERMVYLSEKS
jgi:L-ascorbate metabolism protein UlaG (beta-lactamase superfamily)